MSETKMDEIINISRLEGLVRDVTKTKYRHIYVLEENYINSEGKTTDGLDTRGNKIQGEDIISISIKGDDIFEWKGKKFDPNWDIILPNYKGITDCVAHGFNRTIHA